MTEERTDLDTYEAALGTHENIGRSTLSIRMGDGGDKGRARAQDQDQIEIETNLPYGRNGGMNGNGFAADNDNLKAADKTSSGP